MRIFLTGFMGAGKTTVGEQLARLLGSPFLDLDQEIERRRGETVREIFARYGEPAFRRLEIEILADLMEQERLVLATGGGTMASDTASRMLRSAGLSIWLNPTFATIVSRIGGRGKLDRPLFRDEEQALALYQSRLPAYRRADLTVDIGPGEAAEEVAARVSLLLADRRCAI
jgi:shikimate kinase